MATHNNYCAQLVALLLGCLIAVTAARQAPAISTGDTAPSDTGSSNTTMKSLDADSLRSAGDRSSLCSGSGGCFMENTGCIGTDLNSGVPSSSDHDCQNKCAVSTGCEYWTRNRDDHDSPGARGKCYLKDACSKKISNPATSGPKSCGC